MSNQMRKVLILSLVLASLTLGLSLIVLFIKGEFLSIVSWISVGVSAILIVILLSLYIQAKKDEKELRGQIAYYRLVHKLREKAILDFYSKFGIPPQYNKDGKLLTPDEYLGILTKLDKKGQLDPSIYEMLGIMPMFDENGKEIPRVLVLKHLIRAIKREGLTEIPKLKGLYKKGTKKEAEKKPAEKKPEAKKEEKKEDSKKKGAGGNKLSLFSATRYEKKNKKVEDKKETKGDKTPAKPKENDAKKTDAKKQETPKEEPKIEKVFGENSKSTSGGQNYLNSMWQAKEQQKRPAEKNNQQQKINEEVGEATFE